MIIPILGSTYCIFFKDRRQKVREEKNIINIKIACWL